jgi:hypothetical protein
MAILKANKRNNEQNYGQVKIISGIVIVVLCILVAGVLFLNRGPKLADPAVFGSGVRVFGQLDVNTVKLACSKFAKASFGKRLKYLRMDDRSSRYDPKKSQFRVFMEAELYPEDGTRKMSDAYYFNCSSNKKSLALEEFEVIKIEAEDVKAGRKGKNSRYGWQ